MLKTAQGVLLGQGLEEAAAVVVDVFSGGNSSEKAEQEWLVSCNFFGFHLSVRDSQLIGST